MIELVPLARQFQAMKEEILQAASEIIDSGKYILGPHVRGLEQQAADYLGVSEAIGVANGTDALILTLDAFGVGPGDEVITTPFTFIATAEAISRVGATPVFIDIDRVTYNLNASLIEEKITERTKAIIPVHLFGQPADMDEIMAIAQRHGLIVIEDACQAFGALYKGRRVGSLGHAACFSFFPTKNLGTIGDGGLVVTSDTAIAQRIRKLRQHGSVKKYFHSDIGYNSRLDELHAAILQLALGKIEAWNETRQRLAARYRLALHGHSSLAAAQEAQGRSHIYHLFIVEAADSSSREAAMKRLAERGIQSGVYYPRPLHLQAAYAELGCAAGSMPVAEQMAERLFAVPLSPYLTLDEQDEVITALCSLDRGPNA